MNLLDFYSVKRQTLALELSPETKSFRGQIKIELVLQMVDSESNGDGGKGRVSRLAQQIEQVKRDGSGGRIQLEAAILAKQVKVVEVWLLNRDQETGELKKDQAQKFAESNLAEPVDQAKVMPSLYQGLSRHLYQLDDVQRTQIRRYLNEGTIQLKLKKKQFQFKNSDKIKPKLHFMIDYMCDHITDVGGIKCLSFRRELADQLAITAQNNTLQSKSEFYFTSDEPN